MKKLWKTIMVGLVFFSFASCNPEGLTEDVPFCIKKKIKSIEKEEQWNPPAQVWKWEVDGDVYYYFTSDCCDKYSSLLDNKCNYVCAPDGGVDGMGDGLCPTFEGEIKPTLVWQDY